MFFFLCCAFAKLTFVTSFEKPESFGRLRHQPFLTNKITNPQLFYKSGLFIRVPKTSQQLKDITEINRHEISLVIRKKKENPIIRS